RWDLQVFVDGMKARGFVISNFYNTVQPGFRLGCIGAITPDDMRHTIDALEITLNDMQIVQRMPRLPS
ncbi:MAG: hypothetical protein ACRYG8_05590, partial [Janthinobacterium lividum]